MHHNHSYHMHNYPNDYGSYESCSITVQNVSAGETLFSTAFNTEPGWDLLIVKGVTYEGTIGPSGVAVAVNDSITWSSDEQMNSHSGFQVCLVEACLETNGSQANLDACGCGTAVCSSTTGLFCTSSTNTCSQYASCSVEDGSEENSNACACGARDCTTSTGLFCLGSHDKCAQVAACAKTNGSENSNNCTCGARDCTTLTGLFCLANHSQSVSPSYTNSSLPSAIIGK